jgi:hypothetical protein
MVWCAGAIHKREPLLVKAARTMSTNLTLEVRDTIEIPFKGYLANCDKTRRRLLIQSSFGDVVKGNLHNEQVILVM